MFDSKSGSSNGGNVLYRQFTLQRESEYGEHELVTWLPERKGKLVIREGMQIQIQRVGGKDPDPEWWRIASVGSSTVSQAVAVERARRHMKWRAATDC